MTYMYIIHLEWPTCTSAQISPWKRTGQGSFLYHYITKKIASQSFVCLQKLINSITTWQLFIFKASGILLSSQIIWLVSKCATYNKSSYMVNRIYTLAQSCNAMKTSVSTSLTPILSSFCCSTYSSSTCHSSLRPGSRRFDSILQG